jgi:hypothetical protein
MNGNLCVLAYAACGLLIVVYAWGRSNVQPSSLGLVLLVYLAFGGPLFAHISSISRPQPGGLLAAGKVAHVQLVTIGLTVWLMHRHAYLRAYPSAPPRFFSYIASSIVAATVGAAVCLVFHAGDADPLTGTWRNLRAILLSFPLCAALTFFRDHWAADTTRSCGLRRAETVGCALAMVLGISLLYSGELFPLVPNVMHGWSLVTLIAATSAIALVIGGCAPRLVREEGVGTVVREDASRMAVGDGY